MDIELQEFKFLNYQINSQIAEIIINRPPINAFNIRLLDEILSSLELAKNDGTVRAVLIKSNLEKIFCAGLDLDILIDKPILKVREFLERLYVMPNGRFSELWLWGNCDLSKLW